MSGRRTYLVTGRGLDQMRRRNHRHEERRQELLAEIAAQEIDDELDAIDDRELADHHE